MATHIILLVEDSEDDAELTRRTFARCNIQNPIIVLSSAEDTAAYLQGIRAHGGDTCYEPVLILLDLNLSGMKGIEFLRSGASGALLRQCPVVVLSGIDEIEEVTECYKLGVTSFLTKPITDVEVMNLVQNVPRLTLNPTAAGKFELVCV